MGTIKGSVNTLSSEKLHLMVNDVLRAGDVFWTDDEMFNEGNKVLISKGDYISKAIVAKVYKNINILDIANPNLEGYAGGYSEGWTITLIDNSSKDSKVEQIEKLTKQLEIAKLKNEKDNEEGMTDFQKELSLIQARKQSELEIMQRQSDLRKEEQSHQVQLQMQMIQQHALAQKESNDRI